MKMKCIVSQVHIPEADVQGNLTADDKLKLVELGIKHLRKNNPVDYIIFTGHGKRPSNSVLDLCNDVYWEDVCRPLTAGGVVQGMPAQYFFVSKGIKMAREAGFRYCLKTRGDCLIALKRITGYCHGITKKENKKILLTQQTCTVPHFLGDCFMYGDIDLLDKIWDDKNPVVHQDGLQNTGLNFVKALKERGHAQSVGEAHKGPAKIFGRVQDWNELLKKNASFRDIVSLKFVDLRWNFHKLNEAGWDKMSQMMLEGGFNFKPYLWGRTNDWLKFDKKGKLVHTDKPVYTEESFYETDSA